jgi:hypothetical protein
MRRLSNPRLSTPVNTSKRSLAADRATVELFFGHPRHLLAEGAAYNDAGGEDDVKVSEGIDLQAEAARSGSPDLLIYQRCVAIAPRACQYVIYQKFE